MKSVLIAALALAAIASAAAGEVSSADSVRDTPLPEPAFPRDILRRSPYGHLQQSPPENDHPVKIEPPDLRALPPGPPAASPLPDPRPITPLGARGIYALSRPQMPSPAKMPMVSVDGVAIDPKMPMKEPDPGIDYKLHVRDNSSPASDDAKK